MIPVSLPVLVLLYLALLLGPIFGAWLFNEYRRGQRERAAFRNVLRCAICAYEFEDPSGTLLPRCPRCGSLNERHPLSGL